MAQTTDGAIKCAARRVGLSEQEYRAALSAGMKWCTRCKSMHDRAAFGADVSRYDGLSSACLESNRVKERKVRIYPTGPRGWFAPTRDGDKQQARSRVNYLVKQGRLPDPNDVPCVDCGHVHATGGPRHEYDHHLGYSAEHQLDVQAVCSGCHTKRGQERGELWFSKRRT